MGIATLVEVFLVEIWSPLSCADQTLIGSVPGDGTVIPRYKHVWHGVATPLPGPRKLGMLEQVQEELSLVKFAVAIAVDAIEQRVCLFDHRAGELQVTLRVAFDHVAAARRRKHGIKKTNLRPRVHVNMFFDLPNLAQGLCLRKFESSSPSQFFSVAQRTNFADTSLSAP